MSGLLITRVLVTRIILEERDSDQVPDGKDWFVVRSDVVSEREWLSTPDERKLAESALRRP